MLKTAELKHTREINLYMIRSTYTSCDHSPFPPAIAPPYIDRSPQFKDAVTRIHRWTWTGCKTARASHT